MQTCDYSHTLLYLVQFFLKRRDAAQLRVSLSICQQVWHALDAIHNLRVQFAPYRKLPLAQSPGQYTTQQRHAAARNDEKRHGIPCQYRAEDRE